MTVSACRYNRGDWSSSCDPLLHLKNRTDLLRPRSRLRPGARCPDRRVVNKRCQSNGFGNGVDRGECDACNLN